MDQNLDTQALGLTDIILSEVLQGLVTDASFARVRQNLLKYEIFDNVGGDIAIASAGKLPFSAQQRHYNP